MIKSAAEDIHWARPKISEDHTNAAVHHGCQNKAFDIRLHIKPECQEYLKLRFYSLRAHYCPKNCNYIEEVSFRHSAEALHTYHVS